MQGNYIGIKAVRFNLRLLHVMFVTFQNTYICPKLLKKLA